VLLCLYMAVEDVAVAAWQWMLNAGSCSNEWQWMGGSGVVGKSVAGRID
jgi:hypothetical protein